MIYTDILTVAINIDDKIKFMADKEKNVRDRLEKDWKGRMWHGEKKYGMIMDIVDILKMSECIVITATIETMGVINVRFSAKMLEVRKWDYIVGAKVIDNKDYIRAELGNMLITTPPRDIDKPKIGQKISVRATEIVATPRSTIMNISASLIVCDQGYCQYIVPEDNDIGPVASIKKELERRKKLPPTQVMFFDGLLTTRPQKDTIAVGDWKGPGRTGYPADYVNILEMIEKKALTKGKYISRPLDICRSSPLVRLSNSPEVGIKTIEDPLCVWFQLDNIYNVLKCVNDMSVQYTEQDIKDNESIWKYMRSKQKNE